MKTRCTLALALLAVFLMATASSAAEPQVTATSIDAALVKLGTPIRDGDTVHEHAYLVRIKGEFPAPGAPLLRLYFGDTAIPAYGDFPGGLYFLVLEKAELTALGGKTLRWRIDDGPLHDTGVRFAPSAFEPFTAIPEKDALLR